MDLQSARDVKNELNSIFALERGILRGKRRRFALGVAAPGADASSYRVAVRAPSEEALPPEAVDVIRASSGGEVEVRYTGAIVATSLRAPSAMRGVAIGASIAHYRCMAGTLGFFARRSRDGAIGLVSNNHVIAAEDKGSDQDEILHPAPADGGVRPRDVIARLAGDYPRLKQSNARVDCAFAPLVEGRAYDAWSLDDGRTLSATAVAPYADPIVSKVGRTTGCTVGHVSAFELDGVEVEYSFGKIRFNAQIEIDSTNDTPFSCPGDSGSLVFTHGGLNPIGLLYAGSAAGGASNCGLSYANPIEDVLSILGVTFVS